MHKSFKHFLWLILAAALAVSGCGRKEAPQVVSDGSAKPQISDLRHSVEGNVMRLDFRLSGDPAGVGYQIDRTQIDPYCQCPGFWRRYFEQPVLAAQANTEINKMITLKSAKIEYVFRIRAIDAAGNFGPWSKMIRVRGVDLFNK